MNSNTGELEKMHKGLSIAACAICMAACLSGCDDTTPQPRAPAQQNPSTGSQSAAKTSLPKNPQIVRGGLRFVEGYQAGVETAAAERKPMLLFFTAAWCSYCHQLAADAFTDANVVHLSERFVCVLIDADREPNVCAYFRVGSYPTIQFVSARGQLLNRMVGKRPGHVLVRQMHAALQALAQASEDDKRTR